MTKDFEVGKFYAVSLYPTYGGTKARYIAALCTRILKKKIEFEYIAKGADGIRRKVKIVRGLYRATERNNASTFVNDKWSMISQTTADMEVEKPEFWEESEG